jgi:hypothetical protein
VKKDGSQRLGATFFLSTHKRGPLVYTSGFCCTVGPHMTQDEVIGPDAHEKRVYSKNSPTHLNDCASRKVHREYRYRLRRRAFSTRYMSPPQRERRSFSCRLAGHNDRIDNRTACGVSAKFDPSELYWQQTHKQTGKVALAIRYSGVSLLLTAQQVSEFAYSCTNVFPPVVADLCLTLLVMGSPGMGRAVLGAGYPFWEVLSAAS